MAGFTLIEMIVVLAILGLVGGLVLARGPSRSAALDMRTAATTVASALRLARSQAIATNRPTQVRFDPTSARLQVGSQPARALPAGIAMAVKTVRGPRSEAPAIEFLPDGSSSGGQVALSGEGRAAQVGVDWLTGRVSLGPPS